MIHCPTNKKGSFEVITMGEKASCCCNVSVVLLHCFAVFKL